MKLRKVNMLMIFFSLVGGVIGYLVGEYIMSFLEKDLPDWLMMGLYFGQYAFWVGLFCLLAETISPRLNGVGWKQRHMGFSWKMLLPATLLMLFLAGSLFQLLYGLTVGKSSSAENLVMLLDVSGSMSTSDPNGHMVDAATDFIKKIDFDKKVAIITFHDQASVIQPLVQVKNQSNKDQIIEKLKAAAIPSGGTNIEKALEESMSHLNQINGSASDSMLVLMSDGYSDVDLNKALSQYKQTQTVINTIGLKSVDTEGTELLKNIAAQTNGMYYNVEEPEQLSTVFTKIYDLNQQDRLLISEREGWFRDNVYYAFLRVVLITLIGILIGLSIGMIFDNKYLAKSFSIGGIVAGILAGFILELGLRPYMMPDLLPRLLSCTVLAVLVTMFTAIVPIQERSVEGSQGRFTKGRNTSAKTFENREITTKKFD